MSSRRDRVFVLRFWREPSKADEPWRGLVLEIGGERSIASAHLDDLTDFIKLRLNATDPGRDPPAS